MAGRFTSWLAACLWLGILSGASASELAVIVNRDSPISQLTPQQVSDLYLGRARTVDRGPTLKVLDLPRDSEPRKQFFQRLNGMPIQQVNAY